MSGFDNQLEQSDYISPVRKKTACRWWNITRHTSFSLASDMSLWLSGLRLVAVSQETWVQFLISAEFLCSSSAILCGIEPVSAMKPAHSILQCSLYFFFLDFLSGNFALTELWILTQPSDFSCFGELELGASLGPGPALAHMCRAGTWAEIIVSVNSVKPWSWMTARSVALFIPDFSKIQKNQRPHKRLF